MKKTTAIEVLENYRVRLRFENRAEGEVDFSVHVGKDVFAPWTDHGLSRKASVGEHGRMLTWPGGLDLCADALWLEVTDKKPEDLLANLRHERRAGRPAETCPFLRRTNVNHFLTTGM
jgi:hypothetical protein